MAGPVVSVTGDKELIVQLRKMGATMKTQVRNAVNRAGLAVQARAKVNTTPNVRTGRLRSSIALRFTDSGMAAEVGTDVEYAPYVEYGTRRSRAYPFLGPAWEDTRPEFERELESIVKGAGL